MVSICFDTLMIQCCLMQTQIGKNLGHKSMSTTMDTYAELAPQRKLETVSIYLDKIAKLTY